MIEMRRVQAGRRWRAGVAARTRRSVVGPVLAVMFAVACLSACQADASIVGVLDTDQADQLDVVVDTCHADLDVSVEESDAEVVIGVHNNDRRLFDTGSDDCQDIVRVHLDSPVGDRSVRVTDDAAVTTTRTHQTIDGYTLIAFIPLAAVASAVGLFTARRSGRPRALTVLTCLSIAAIVAITIGGRIVKLTGWGYAGLHLDWLGAESWRHLLDIDAGWLRNVALFVPAGALLTWTTRRLGVSMIVLVALSLSLEMIQRTWLLGAADVRDTFANTIGAVLGGTAAVIARRRSNGARAA